MKYEVVLQPSIKKQLKRIDKKQAERLLVHIYALAYDPFPVSSKSLKNRNDYSMRVGDYRVLYEVNGVVLKVYVLKVGHRKDVYKS